MSGDAFNGEPVSPPRPIGEGARSRRQAGRRVAVAGAVLLAHLGAARLLMWAEPTAFRVADPPVVSVAMIAPPKPPPPAPEPKPAPPDKAGGKTSEPAVTAPAPASRVRPTPAPSVRPVLAAAPVRANQPFLELGEDDARGAAGSGGGSGGGSGSGGGGGDCDMVRRLQAALAKDNRVKAAVSGALGERTSTGRGMVVWNGDWVTHSGQEGKGLAAVRQAIMWEVGFAPKACREQAMRGYVVLSLEDHTRIALGDASWRWSDLLGLR